MPNHNHNSIQKYTTSTADKITVDAMSVDEMSVDQMPFFKSLKDNNLHGLRQTL